MCLFNAFCIFKCLVMKNQIISFFFFFPLLFSCNKDDNNYPEPCKNGNCLTNYKIVYMGDTVPQSSNGFWEIEFAGLNYFQINGDLPEVKKISPSLGLSSLPIGKILLG